MKGGSNMEKKIIGAVLIVAVIALIVYLFAGASPTVTAIGSSSIEVQPDEVEIYINVASTEDSAQTAKDKVNSITDEVVIQLMLLGFDKSEIQTQGFSVYPEYNWETREEKGFTASQSIVLKTNDFNKVAEIVDAAVDSGALVSYINFGLSEEKRNEFKAEALKLAGEDAKRKAEATASGLDKNLGSLVSVNSESFDFMPYTLFESGTGGDAKQAALDLTPSDVEVTASVSVEYRLRSF